MFSSTAEYALRAMVVLAGNPGSLLTAQQIATQAKVPIDYLMKVLQSLGRAGMLTAQRGKHGGFILVRDAASVSILDIVNAVDPIKRIESCPLGIRSHGTVLCPLHRRLDTALRLVEECFSGTTLAELLDEPIALRPLCGGLVEVHAS